MHGRAYKQYISRSYNTSTFKAVRFDGDPYTCPCENKTKRLKGFKFRTFIGCFQVTRGSEGVKNKQNPKTRKVKNNGYLI